MPRHENVVVAAARHNRRHRLRSDIAMLERKRAGIEADLDKLRGELRIEEGQSWMVDDGLVKSGVELQGCCGIPSATPA